MVDARLAIDEPSVLTQVISQLNDLHLHKVDADTKGDLFEHVLSQIRQAGELGQFRTPRHIIRTLVKLVDPKLGETVYDPAAGTAGFLVGTWDHIRLTNSSPAGCETVSAEGKEIQRGLGDLLRSDEIDQLKQSTFFGTDVDPQMVRLATMNLTLRELDKVRIWRYDTLTRPLDRSSKTKLGFPTEGFDVILANPPFSGRVNRDRIVESVKIGRTGQTELLFLQLILNQLKEGGRCGVIVPEGVLFGSTIAHSEFRRRLVDENTVNAVLSLPNGVFNPYSGVKTSLLVFKKGGTTDKVIFLCAENDGFKLDARHDQPIVEDDLPELIDAYHDRDALRKKWCGNQKKVWSNKWWFADATRIREAEYNLCVDRYRPRHRSNSSNRNPVMILDELQHVTANSVSDTKKLIKLLQDRKNSSRRKNLSESVPLEKLAMIIKGQAPPSDTYNKEGQGLPFFQGKAEFGSFHPTATRWCTKPKKVALAGDILMSIRAPVGPTNIASEQCCIGTGLVAIRPIENIAIRDFVLWALKFYEPDIASKGQGSTSKSIRLKDLSSFEIPLPPINDQRRIATQLNLAAEISRQRETSEELIGKFIPSLIDKLFGELSSE